MADTYSPTSGMKAAARRALKWKADGKATGAGTPVGWGRAITEREKKQVEKVWVNSPFSLRKG